jgi:hypothetical protein
LSSIRSSTCGKRLRRQERGPQGKRKMIRKRGTL